MRWSSLSPLTNVLCLACAPALRVPREAELTALVGCYDVSLGPWNPAFELGEDQVFIEPPAHMILGPGDRSAALEPAGPTPGTTPSIHQLNAWALRGQSVEVSWSTGHSGVVMTRLREGSDLRGAARTFWDFPRPSQSAPALAKRVACPEP